MTDPGDALRTALHDPFLDHDMGAADPVALLSGVLDRRDRLRRRRQRLVVGAAAAAAVLWVAGPGVPVGMLAAGPAAVAPAAPPPIPAPGQVGLIDPPSASPEP